MARSSSGCPSRDRFSAAYWVPPPTIMGSAVSFRGREFRLCSIAARCHVLLHLELFAACDDSPNSRAHWQSAWEWHSRSTFEAMHRERSNFWLRLCCHVGPAFPPVAGEQVGTDRRKRLSH